MTSSGKTRGLAAAAVGVVTLGLLPLMSAPASAATIDPAVLYSQYTGGVSTSNDGTNQSIHLLATADAAATSVQFAYSTDSGTTWVNIGAPVAASHGVYSKEWAPSAADYTNMAGKTTIDIQAQGMNGGATVGSPDSATVSITGIVTAASVDISNAAGSSVGAYVATTNTGASPAWTAPQGDTLAIVSGTTSGSAVQLSARSITSPVNNAATVGSPTAGISDFSGLADFVGYDFAASPLATAVVGANVDSGASDDAEVLSLYQQQITNVTAAPVTPNVQGTATTNIVVTVTDQNGKPIAGAHVTDESNTNPGVTLTDGRTGIDGKVVFDNGAAGFGAGSYKFYVDTDGTDGYQPGIDFERTATVTSYTPTPTTMSTASSLGNVVDNDESPVIDVTVKDQDGNEMSGQTFSYYWSHVDNKGANPADGLTGSGADGTPVSKGWTGSTAGKWTLHAWIESDGTPGPTAGDLKAPTRTFTVGETGVVWDSAPLAQVAAGATTALNGVLEIVDGTSGSVIDGATLGDRNVTFGYTAGTGGGADSTVTESSPVKSGANGSVTLHVADPVASPQAAETGASLNAQLSGDGDQAVGPLAVDFLTNLSPATVAVSGATPLITNATPGRPVDFTVTVKNADGVALTNTSVGLSADHGFFTPYAASADGLTPDPMPTADGDLYGSWKSLGSSITRTTDQNGQVKVTLAIGRDAGFDGDGLVTSKLTATAGSKSGNNTVDFSTIGAPLNAGTLTVAFADAAQQDSTVLPDARVNNQNVCFDIKATDQFGNRVKTTAVTAASSDATHAPITAGGTSSNFAGACGATVNADMAESSTITATWGSPPSDVYKDSDLVTAGFQYDPTSHGAASPAPADMTADSPQVNWYDIDLANSTFGLSHDTNDVVKVGTVVTERLTALDQHGQPISGVDVSFFRSGPTPQDGTSSASGTTNADGQIIFSYDGTGAGTGEVTATVTQGATVLAKVTDSVKFMETITATLRGKSITLNGKHYDLLVVRTSPDAAGSVVVFRDGRGHLLGKGKVNSNGVARLRVLDQKPRRARAYKAHVRAGSLTFAANTNRIRIK